MTIFDFVIFTIITLSTLFAFVKGFIRTGLSLLGWIATFIITLYIYPSAMIFLEQYTQNRLIIMSTSTVGVFLTVAVIFGLINAYLLTLMDGFRKGLIDRSLGIGFGLVRGVVFGTIILVVIQLLNPIISLGKKDADEAGPEWLTTSSSYGFLTISSHFIWAAIPEDIRKDIDTSIGAAIKGNKSAEEFLLPKINSDTIAQLYRVMPKAEREALLKKYNSNTLESSNSDMMRAFVTHYIEALQKGAVEQVNQLSDEQLAKLKQAYKVEGHGREEGYSAEDIHAIDRLIIEQE